MKHWQPMIEHDHLMILVIQESEQKASVIRQLCYCIRNVGQPICIIERPLGATIIVIFCRAICQIRRIIYACSS